MDTVRILRIDLISITFSTTVPSKSPLPLPEDDMMTVMGIVLPLRSQVMDGTGKPVASQERENDSVMVTFWSVGCRVILGATVVNGERERERERVRERERERDNDVDDL